VRTHLKIILLQNSALGITSRAKGKLQPEHAGTHTHTHTHSTANQRGKVKPEKQCKRES